MVVGLQQSPLVAHGHHQLYIAIVNGAVAVERPEQILNEQSASAERPPAHAAVGEPSAGQPRGAPSSSSASLRQARLVGSHARHLRPWPGVPLIACAEAAGRNRAVK